MSKQNKKLKKLYSKISKVLSILKPEKSLTREALTTAIGRAVSIVSPRAGAKYLRAQAAFRAYDAAVVSYHHNEYWRPGLKTGDREIGKDWRVSTERSRDLDRNHPLVSDALKVGFAFTVGSALNPQWNILKSDKTRDEKSIELIEDAFKEWCLDCTVNGIDWQEVKRLVYRHLKIDGEVFAVESSDKYHAFKLQLIEASQINESIDGTLNNGRYAIRGIEFDKYGRPYSYHFYETDPNGFSLIDKDIEIMADRVHHVFMPGRITETRGICHYVSAIMSLYDQNELSDQILELHRNAAAFGIFVHTEDIEDELEGLRSERLPNGENDKIKDVGGIKVNYLNPLERTSSVKPEMPTGSFLSYDQSYLRKCARGFSMSYETFTGDLSNANFSSLKAGQNNERALFRLESDLIIRKFCAPIVRKWLDTEVLMGLNLPGYFANKKYYQKLRFTLPALPSADPGKDEKADKAALENKTNNRRLICERKGIDFEENVEQLKLEDEIFGLNEPDVEVVE